MHTSPYFLPSITSISAVFRLSCVAVLYISALRCPQMESVASYEGLIENLVSLETFIEFIIFSYTGYWIDNIEEASISSNFSSFDKNCCGNMAYQGGDEEGTEIKTHDIIGLTGTHWIWFSSLEGITSPRYPVSFYTGARLWTHYYSLIVSYNPLAEFATLI